MLKFKSKDLNGFFSILLYRLKINEADLKNILHFPFFSSVITEEFSAFEIRVLRLYLIAVFLSEKSYEKILASRFAISCKAFCVRSLLKRNDGDFKYYSS